MKSTRIDTIIFDLDGTLLDTAGDVHRCSNMALERMGIRTITLKEAKLSIGPGSDNFARITLGEDNAHRFTEFITIFRELYRDRCLDTTRPFPGIVELLKELGDRHLLVATNKPTIYSRHILEGLSLLDYFKAVLGPEDVLHIKPHPEMITLGVARGGGDGEATIVVGDTDNDIRAAQNAGVRACAVTWGYGPLPVLEKHRPDYIINEPSELLGIVNGLC